VPLQPLNEAILAADLPHGDGCPTTQATTIANQMTSMSDETVPVTVETSNAMMSTAAGANAGNNYRAIRIL